MEGLCSKYYNHKVIRGDIAIHSDKMKLLTTTTTTTTTTTAAAAAAATTAAAAAKVQFSNIMKTMSMMSYNHSGFFDKV